MLGQILVSSINRNVISLSLVLGQQPLFPYILKSFKTLLIQIFFYRHSKKYKQDKKRGKHFDLKTYSLIDKEINYFNKIQNSYFTTNYQNFAQTTKLKSIQTIFDRAYSNLTPYLFLSKN